MYRILMSSVVVVALVSLTGCGPSADTLAQRRIDQLNELADAMEAGKDEATIEAISERVKETSTALEDMDLSDAEWKKLNKEYGTETIEAQARVCLANVAEVLGANVAEVPGANVAEMKDMVEGMKNGMPGKMPTLP